MFRVVTNHTAQKITEVFDRHHLAILHDRFIDINTQRLIRMNDALSDRQKKFVDALPLLFHCNHPMLPGYVGHEAPCGISGFSPSKTDIAKGRALSSSFNLRPYATYSEDILGIFSMGSVGTIAQTARSDLDIWLCCSPSLDEKQKKSLGCKCEKITAWAESLNLEVHFFLMDCDMFRQGHLSDLDEDSSGSAQHYLLLDEFYRTSIHIAGQIPLWWFVPSDKESDYETTANKLLHNRYINPNTVLDFGPIPKIPDNEFLGAAIWQLYKAIESPYKSILKLFMLETYVAQYDQGKPLCLSFKEKVYKGSTHLNELDPYIMVYERIENFFMRTDQLDRLDLARRCFYFKINKPLTNSNTSRQRNWRYDFLSQLVSDWGWSEETYAELDQRANWKAIKVTEERNHLISALNKTYHSLCSGIDNLNYDSVISSREIKILGRKLRAAYDRRPGKIELINSGLSKHISEHRLRIEKLDFGEGEIIWQTCVNAGFNKGILMRKDQMLHRASSLVELLTWLCLNGIVVKQTVIELAHTESRINSHFIKQFLRLIVDWISGAQKVAPHFNFRNPAAPEKLLLFINVDIPADARSAQSYYIRDAGNIFNHGQNTESLIKTIDVLEKNTWNEIVIKHYSGKNSLNEFLNHYLSMAVPGSFLELPPINIHCLGVEHNSAIERRIEEWLAKAADLYKKSRTENASRFIYRIEDEYSLMEFNRGKFKHYKPESTRDLMLYLSEPQDRFCAIHVDMPSVKHSLLREIAKRNHPNSIEIFLEKKKKYFQLYLCDERGSLVFEQLPLQNIDNTLASLHLFLHNINRRIVDQRPRQHTDDSGLMPVHCYRVFNEGSQIYYEETKFGGQGYQFDKKLISVTMRMDESNMVGYDFQFENQIYRWSEWHNTIFEVVAQVISTAEAVSNGASMHDLSCIISDIDASDCVDTVTSFGNLQSSQYLHLKHSLEQRLKNSISPN